MSRCLMASLLSGICIICIGLFLHMKSSYVQDHEETHSIFKKNYWEETELKTHVSNHKGV